MATVLSLPLFMSAFAGNLVSSRSFRGSFRSAGAVLAFTSWHPCGGGVRCNGALVSFFPVA